MQDILIVFLVLTFVSQLILRLVVRFEGTSKWVYFVVLVVVFRKERRLSDIVEGTILFGNRLFFLLDYLLKITHQLQIGVKPQLAILNSDTWGMHLAL